MATVADSELLFSRAVIPTKIQARVGSDIEVGYTSGALAGHLLTAIRFVPLPSRTTSAATLIS